MKKKILFVTTTRADFNLQKELILILQKKYKCFLLCTGTHFDKRFGYSYKYVLESKIKNLVNYKLKNFKKENFSLLHTKYLNIFGKTLNKINPKLICLFGDRSEILIASFIGYSLKIPIAHFHGGEVTTGSLDDNYRQLGSLAHAFDYFNEYF